MAPVALLRWLLLSHWDCGEVGGVLVGGVEVVSDFVLSVDGLLQSDGEDAQGSVDVGVRGFGVDPQVSGAVLVVEPVGELA